jgi:hypothetical protein
MHTKILNYLLKHTDKMLHFTAGMIIFLIASVFLPVWLAVCMVVLAGLAKEVRDKISYGGFDWIDFAATIAGGIFVWICLYLNGI